MKLAIVLGLIAFLFFIALLTTNEAFIDSGPHTNPPTIRQNFNDISIYSDKIANASAPPGVNMTSKLIYSAADLIADNNDIRNKITNLEFNTPGYIKQQVSEQLFAATSGPKQKQFYSFADDETPATKQNPENTYGWSLT